MKEEPGNFSIGSEIWPGVSKLIEETGELNQVLGKLIGANGDIKHWDGTDLQTRLQDELADVQAAIRFVVAHTKFDTREMERRVDDKFALFQKWHHKAAGTNRPHSDQTPSLRGSHYEL